MRSRTVKQKIDSAVYDLDEAESSLVQAAEKFSADKSEQRRIYLKREARAFVRAERALINARSKTKVSA